jgi:Tfp pilus assembly protein PilF
VNKDAHQDYLQGRYHWHKRTTADLHKAVELFESAIERAPEYAEAYVGLAQTYLVLPAWDPEVSGQGLFTKARNAAEKALEIAPDNAGAYTCLATVEQLGSSWDDAEENYRRAIELNPSDVTGHQWYAEFLYYMGRFDDALKQINIALKLDPLSLILQHVNTYMAGSMGDIDRMEELGRRAKELHRTHNTIDYALFYGYAQMGMHKESLTAWADYLDQTANDDEEREDALRFRQTLTQGHSAGYRDLIRQNLRKRRHSYVMPGVLGTQYAAIGDVDSAMIWLEVDVAEQGFYAQILIGVDRRFDPIRNDPRFQSLVRHQNLFDAQERAKKYYASLPR